MYRGKVDPIEYAWGSCNQGVSLPTVLARTVFRDPVATRVAGEIAASRAGTHSWILRTPLHRNSSKLEIAK